MAIEFRDVDLAPLRGFSAVAPNAAAIGLIGPSDSGVSEILKLAGGRDQPASGVVSASGAQSYAGLSDSLDGLAGAVISIDHTLALQDALERAKSAATIGQLRRAGATILIASHEGRLLESTCDEVWWIEKGRLVRRGDPRETLDAYSAHVAQEIRDWGKTARAPLQPALRRGDGRAAIVALETLGACGEPTMVWRSGERVTARVTARYRETVDDPVVGIMIRTRVGFEVYGTNTELEHIRFGPCQAGVTARIDFAMRCDLCPGDYTLTAASHDPDGTAHDWVDNAVAFVVTDSRFTAGVANLRACVQVEKL
jgi:hypothetical protein